MYLKGFLNTKNISSFQADLGIEVILALFCKTGLQHLFDSAAQSSKERSLNTLRIISLQATYIKTINPVISFLQGSNPDLAYSISQGDYLPEASRFEQLDDLDWAFGSMGIHDKARHLATLYLEDISDLIVEAIDPHFGFSRYADRLARSASSFDDLDRQLQGPNTFIDDMLINILQRKVDEVKPTIVALSVPFPGNLYSALKCGQWLKINRPDIKVVMGGGYINTELRSLKEPRVFQYVDFITLDDGEAPLYHLIEFLEGIRSSEMLKRIFLLNNNTVDFKDGSPEPDYPLRLTGTPDYADLHLDKYLSVIEVANPMHRLWSDGRWNKLTLAHGCYWGKCTFCDISLDYIQRYEPLTASLICDRIEEIINKTGQNGFHFVDEAAPPSLLKALAIEIIKRGLTVVWWTNIRFEKNFTGDLCRLLAESGCVAISGGLEVASDRLLKLIRKGVTVEQVTTVADNFTQSGIMVHAYLMYGFPTQTAEETIDALEVVRQLFMHNVIQSGFWHLFAMTTHSTVGLKPADFDVEIIANQTGLFANNDLIHIDHQGCDHEAFGQGLTKSLFNYMHGLCFDFTLQEWFDFQVPATNIAPDYIADILDSHPAEVFSPKGRVIWLGGSLSSFDQTKKVVNTSQKEFILHNKTFDLPILLDESTAEWLKKTLSGLSIGRAHKITLAELAEDYQKEGLGDFESFWNSETVQKLRANGLLVL